MDKAEFLKFRTMIIEEFINIETIINSSISYKFFNKYLTTFVFPVLHSPYFSFALRVDILSKIVENFDDNIRSKILQMNNIRNIFVHISPNYFDNKKEGEKITFDEVGWFPNPKKISERLDFEKEFKEFYKLRDEILPYLVGYAESFGASFSKEPPKLPTSDKKDDLTKTP